MNACPRPRNLRLRRGEAGAGGLFGPRCAKIRSTDMGWTDIALTTNTASILLTALGYEMSNSLLGLNIAMRA